jgi:hypothetical protein
MKIDTLVLSGGSTKVPAYVGAFRALRECNIIDEELTGIKNIVVCSVGMLYGLMLLLKVSDIVVETSMKRLSFTEFLDVENINIADLIINLGLFDNQKMSVIITTITREKYNNEHMTLLELYELSGITLTVKVVNSTKSCIEYITHETDPDIPIAKLFQMTTAIPLFFKPVLYNDSLYVDGGTGGSFPTEVAGENYLGINLRGPWRTDKKKTILNDIPIIDFILSLAPLSASDSIEPHSRKIVIPLNVHFTNFSLTVEEKQALIDDGYKVTKKHIEDYQLTNTNKDPNEGGQ